jgi:hypothetical protein
MVMSNLSWLLFICISACMIYRINEHKTFHNNMRKLYEIIIAALRYFIFYTNIVFR